MNTVKLTPRLQCVADTVKPCRFIADIGTDHAYIPVYLVQNGIADKAVASDVVDGPVKIARANIAQFCLTDKISVVRAYGLKSAIGADTAVIAGMGGKLICDILSADMDIAESIGNFVLQPMTCQYELRKFLHCSGFKITEERLAKEDNKIYNIIAVSRGRQEFDDEFYYYTGKYIFDNNDKLLAEYLHKRANVLKRRINGMKMSHNAETAQECKKTEKLYRRLLKEASYYDKSC